MRRHWSQFAIMVGGCLVMPAAIAVLPQPTPAQAVSALAAVSPHDRTPDLCFSYVFYFALPGKSDYCLGLRDWNKGHYVSGLKLLKLAAGWGNKNAQYTLGLIYYSGHHVRVQPALGMAWLKLANERHNDARIDKAARSALHWATPTQRQRAKQLFARMRQKFGDEVAAARAWRHLQHWKFNHGPLARGCAPVAGAQAYALTKVMTALAQRQRLPFNWSPGCPVPVAAQRMMVKQSADTYFEGWMGTVTVGPLETVPAPATSSGH